MEILKEVDNIQIICDSDLDGICSAFLISRILKKFGKKLKIKIRDNEKLEKIANKKFNSYIILDLPFKDEELIEFSLKNKNKKIIYIDHHKREVPENLPKNLYYFDIRALKVKPLTSVCGYVYKIGKKFFGKEFEKYSLIAFVGTYADYFLDKEILKDLKRNYPKLFLNNYFSIALSIFISFLYFEEPKNVLKILEKEDIFEILRSFKLSKAKKLLKIWKRAEIAYEDKELIVIKSKKAREIATILSSFLNKTVLVYFLKKKTVKISLRSDKIDCGEFLYNFTKKHGIVGGGHPNAAGATIWKKDLKKLIKKLVKKLKL
jgi:single-stranded DNA-specific DHH superfamily exonuclease